MIERIYIHRYRCFENFSLDLGGFPSALIVGKNGAGKSTLRHALGVFQSICRGSNRVRHLISLGDFTFQRVDSPMRFEIEASLFGRKYKYAIAFEWPENFREARVAEESLHVDGVVSFTRQQGLITLAGGASFNMDWHVVALPVIHEPPGQKVIQQLKSFLASMILIAPIPSAMTGFAEDDSAELQADASNIASWLNALLKQKPAAYGILESYLKSVIPDFASLENVDRGESGTQLVGKFAQSEPPRSFTVDFKLLSDGEKCFVLSALLIAWNTANGPVFCLWDEPDNHLSLSEVGHFTLGLRKITNQGGQFIATSHHPEAIRNFSDETTIVLLRKSHLDPTVPRPLSQIQRHGDLVDAMIRGEIMG